jgi:hypothetical protein
MLLEKTDYAEKSFFAESRSFSICCATTNCDNRLQRKPTKGEVATQ